MAVIDFQNVSKTFARAGGRMLLRDYMGAFVRRRHRDPFYALRNVSFRVDHGESVAVIGSNGAGKSTLLGLVAGLSDPNEGVVKIEGRVAALLELGSDCVEQVFDDARSIVSRQPGLLGHGRDQVLLVHESPFPPAWSDDARAII